MSTRRSWVSRLAAECREAGCTTKETRNGLLVLAPDGKGVVALHWTCSDHRAERNARAELRRAGVRLDRA